MLARFLIYYRIFLLLICSTVTQASSLTESSSLSWKQTEFLPAEQAFPYEVELSQTQRPELSAHPLQKIQLQWHITEDYYLYQQAFNLASPMQDAKVFGPFFDREAEKAEQGLEYNFAGIFKAMNRLSDSIVCPDCKTGYRDVIRHNIRVTVPEIQRKLATGELPKKDDERGHYA